MLKQDDQSHTHYHEIKESRADVRSAEVQLLWHCCCESELHGRRDALPQVYSRGATGVQIVPSVRRYDLRSKQSADANRFHHEGDDEGQRVRHAEDGDSIARSGRSVCRCIVQNVGSRAPDSFVCGQRHPRSRAESHA